MTPHQVRVVKRQVYREERDALNLCDRCPSLRRAGKRLCQACQDRHTQNKRRYRREKA